MTHTPSVFFYVLLRVTESTVEPYVAVSTERPGPSFFADLGPAFSSPDTTRTHLRPAQLRRLLRTIGSYTSYGAGGTEQEAKGAYAKRTRDCLGWAAAALGGLRGGLRPAAWDAPVCSAWGVHMGQQQQS